MIRKVAIEISDKAFLPEAYAYCDYFRAKGLECELVTKGMPGFLEYDAVLLFHGFHPFWRHYPKFIIGEYHSLSVGHCSRWKDALKRILNVRSDILIFLNDTVRKKLWFSHRSKFLLRGMGCEKIDHLRREAVSKKYDIVYAGSQRDGLWEYVYKFLTFGMTVAVVGNDDSYKKEGLTCFGRVSPCKAREIILQSRYGLNFTPNVFPLNIQDSTKVIEYCSAGLGVITNRYKWVDNFEKNRSAKFLDLDSIKNAKDISEFDFVVPDVSDLEWKTLLENTKLFELLMTSD